MRAATVTAVREHSFDAGHRVAGHEGKCSHIHGHTYTAEFHCRAPALDALGRVVDFGVIKDRLCAWLDESWDHRFLAWEHDPILDRLEAADPEGVMPVPFNPTAENMALYLLNLVGPAELAGTGVELVKVVIHETRKCRAEASL